MSAEQPCPVGFHNHLLTRLPGTPDMVLRPEGQIEKPEKKLDKQTILEQFGMQPRDLRTLDAHILDVRPSLLVCKKSIVLCTPIARAIIAHDRLILIAADKHNPICEAEGAEEVSFCTRTPCTLQYVNPSALVLSPRPKPCPGRTLRPLVSARRRRS